MTITIVLPSYNEAVIIEKTLVTLFRFIDRTLAHHTIRVVVADNGSTDTTAAIVHDFMRREPRLSYLAVRQQGKGHAVSTAWKAYRADWNVFIDADLSADLATLPLLLDALQSGADIAVASRFAPGAVVDRSSLRRCYSWTLRFVLWILFRLTVRDAPCGMKAVTQRVVTELVPVVRDRAWFFDTELLIRAERNKYRIVEIPTSWSDVADRARPSRANMVHVILHYCMAILRLRLSL